MNLSTFVFGSIPLMIQYYAEKYKSNDYEKTLSDLEPYLNIPIIKTYDFIVVGAGTAGSLVAGRLSKHFTVLLLESGGTPPPAASNTFLNEHLFTHPEINHLFKSLPQRNFMQENGGIMNCETGKMLGGSGSHNGNWYARGNPRDYDHIATLTGDDSWSYKHVVQHFKRFENYAGHLIQEEEREKYYGNVGEISVEVDELSPILVPWFQAAKELGFPIDDPNGFQKESFTRTVRSVKNGQRCSTYTEFVKPKDVPGSNLTVVRYSVAEKILIREDKTAYGVVYRRHGIPQISHASKEVIISAGALQSPLLLIKSGVGPPLTLEEAKIPLLLGLPGVGKNFRDHVALILKFEATNPTSAMTTAIFPEVDVEEEINKYQNETGRSGHLTRKNVGCQSFIVSSRAKFIGEGNWPDLQIVPTPRSRLGFNFDTPRVILVNVVLHRPKSRGQVGFNSTAYSMGERDDTKLALIDHNFFSDDTDFDVLIEGIKLAFKIMENTTAFRSMGMSWMDDCPEACKHIPFSSSDSDEFWRCYIKQRARAWIHNSGTCKMGRDDDPEAVVDSKARVIGMKHLRVVDASIIPQLTNANFNGAVMLVAEKCAQDILSEHRE